MNNTNLITAISLIQWSHKIATVEFSLPMLSKEEVNEWIERNQQTEPLLKDCKSYEVIIDKKIEVASSQNNTLLTQSFLGTIAHKTIHTTRTQHLVLFQIAKTILNQQAPTSPETQELNSMNIEELTEAYNNIFSPYFDFENDGRIRDLLYPFYQLVSRYSNLQFLNFSNW